MSCLPAIKSSIDRGASARYKNGIVRCSGDTYLAEVTSVGKYLIEPSKLATAPIRLSKADKFQGFP